MEVCNGRFNKLNASISANSPYIGTALAMCLRNEAEKETTDNEKPKAKKRITRKQKALAKRKAGGVTT